MTRLGLAWNAELLFTKIFLIYLLITSCVSIFRFLKLGWHLYYFGSSKSFPLESISQEEIDADRLAEAALLNKVVYEYRTGFFYSNARSQRIGNQVILRGLQKADNRFLYLWKRNHLVVRYTERMAVITLLVSLLFAAYCIAGVLSGWLVPHDEQTAYLWLLINGAAQILSRFAIGVVICAVIYVVSSFFERVMTRRMTEWQYLYARLKDDLSD